MKLNTKVKFTKTGKEMLLLDNKYPVKDNPQVNYYLFRLMNGSGVGTREVRSEQEVNALINNKILVIVEEPK